jgi:diguanylate cyclase (GGDEF)-like protein
VTRAFVLVLALLVLHVLLGALCLLIARGEHKSPALRWWGWGLLAYAAGLLATISAALGLPRAAATIAGNSLIALSSVVCVRGVLSHTPFRLRMPWVAAALLATVAALVASNLAGWRTLLVNVTAPTVIAAVLFVIAAIAIARQGPRDARQAARLLSVLLLLAVATWIARIAALVLVSAGPAAAERVDLVVSFFAIAQMVDGVAATLALVWIDVRLMQAELARVAHSDALTGLPNRRVARERFGEETARAKRAGRRFAMALFDVDHFKQVNDRHGHATGDAVLRAVADALAAAKRGEDVLARIGGEEFLVLLAQETREGARDAAERLRRAAGEASVAAGAEPLRVTLSGGVALFPDDGADWDHLFASADRRLYAAKREGRDRLESSG